MKTIVILTHVSFDDSPYSRFVHDHAKAMKKQGYNVIVLAVISWFPVLSHFQKRKKMFMKNIKKESKIQKIDGINVIYKKAISFSNFLYHSKINLNGYFYYKSIKKIFRKIYKKEDIVLIDAHVFKTEGYVASKLKKKYPEILTTLTLHGSSFYYNTRTKNGRKQIKKVFHIVDYIVCVSDKLQKIAKNYNNNTVLIYNGVKDYKFQEVNKEQYKYNIICVGMLYFEKKQDITIQALKKLKEKYVNLKLTIVGDGPERENLKNLVSKLNLVDDIDFKGHIENDKVLKLMNESYIFIMPSINEGFGIVYLEAMKAKCITIGTKGEGIDGFIKNGKNGFLVNPEIDEIVKLIDEIYSNKYNLDEIRKRAFYGVSQLTWENNAKKYIKLLEQYYANS